MENSTLLIMAIFILLLALSLLGLFIYLVKATKEDSKIAITRLQGVVNQLRNLDNAQDRTFQEFQLLLTRKLRTVFTPGKYRDMENFGGQTEPVTYQEQGTLTDMVRVTSLPPLLVRPALSSDVIIPISADVINPTDVIKPISNDVIEPISADVSIPISTDVNISIEE